jgi:iron(II)-dependent oxidoreductase
VTGRLDERAGPAAASIVRALDEARARTLALVDLPEAIQRAQISPLMSPMVWDLAHIGNYEELWLLRALDGRPAIDPALDDLYNAFEHPRWTRPDLPLLGPEEARDYLDRVRGSALALLAEIDGAHGESALLREAFVYGLVVQHEHQHCETLLATRQLMGEAAPPVPGTIALDRSPVGAASSRRDGMVRLDGGTFVMGTDGEPWAYDNERPAHPVTVDPFWLDPTPVTVGAFRAFVDDGGYADERWWSAAGRAWTATTDQHRPLYWSDDLESVLRFGRWEPLEADEPVQHVTFHEAQAFARWAGKRLPTEAEWEYAATAHPDGHKQRWPWGDDEPTARHANLGQRHDRPLPVDQHPAGANPWGVAGLVGDVWEWTRSTFDPYPGFVAFPYDEYSLVFFGAGGGDDGYRVLRGGSWATHPAVARTTFRNWDHPIRRQIFSGFRCARDVTDGERG